MRFAVNITMLFTEHAFTDRFEAVAQAGFDAVELWWPPEGVREEIAAAAGDAGVRVVRFSIDTGEPGDRGLLCRPDEEARFRASAMEGIDLARRLGCGLINSHAGVRRPDFSEAEQLQHGTRMMAWLADIAKPYGITVLMEANSTDQGPYLLHTTRDAAAFLDGVRRPNVGLLYDTYHMQRMEGNLSATIRAHARRIAHVQVGDVPDRHEPGTGEINFPFLFGVLDACGYDGYVGLEYRPLRTTAESLRWLPWAFRQGDVAGEAVRALGG